MITQLQSIVGFREQVIDMPKDQALVKVEAISGEEDITDASKVR
jgi:hypothetical protein